MGSWIAKLALSIGGLIAAIWIFGPREPVDIDVPKDLTLDPRTLDHYFATQEARFSDLTPGTEKRVIWAASNGVPTPLSVLYIHGFSATSEEIRPVPDRVAQGLGANLVFTRLAGHGRGGAAMAEPTVNDWMLDVAEALAAARAVGDEVVVIATSTGGTLAALAALDETLADKVKGIAFVSPNFQLANPAAKLLTWPGVRWWGPLLAGRDRRFAPVNDAHAKYWTIQYPSVAVAPMAALVKFTFAQDFSAASPPALFLYAPADKVVSARATEEIAQRWGGTSTLAPQILPAGNDPNNHVIAGDILSPGMTDVAVSTILDWVKQL